jgi:hypothetical protein
MPSYIIKPDRAEDFYVVWSTIVEAPLAFGPREYLQELGEEGSLRDMHYPDRWARADKAGTSERSGRNGGWDDAGFIYQQQGWLPRAKLKELCALLAENENADVSHLLDPLDD